MNIQGYGAVGTHYAAVMHCNGFSKQICSRANSLVRKAIQDIRHGDLKPFEPENKQNGNWCE